MTRAEAKLAAARRLTEDFRRVLGSLATGRCVVCADQLDDPDDRLPCRAGHAHAVCAMAAETARRARRG